MTSRKRFFIVAIALFFAYQLMQAVPVFETMPSGFAMGMLIIVLPFMAIVGGAIVTMALVARNHFQARKLAKQH